MASKDDLNITLDCISETLSDVKEMLKAKQEALTKEDRILLNRLLESQKQSRTDTGFDPESLKELEELKTTISVLQETIDKPSIINNRYTIDFTPGKNILIGIGLVLGLILSMFGNYHQHETNKRLTDNDLKFRLIKMWNGVDSVGLYKIEQTFIYERDNKTINNVRKAVINYERKLKERVAELERARMKEEEAQKLLQEADGLKNK